jgi:hypothetical protein
MHAGAGGWLHIIRMVQQPASKQSRKSASGLIIILKDEKEQPIIKNIQL